MVARVLAVVAAVAMIVGAVAYRSSRDSSETVSAGSPSPGAVSEVVCASELGPVCGSLSGAKVEAAAVTADRLLAARSLADARIAAWIAPGPWADMIDADRRSRSRPALFAKDRVVLAATPLVAIVKPGRLPPGCGGTATWKCLGDAGQVPAFVVGADVATDSTGLLVRAAALGGFFGNSDYASNDFEQSQDWLANLERRFAEARAKNAADVQRFLIQAPDVSVFLTTKAQATSGGATAALVQRPTPPVSVRAVLAQGSDIDDDRVGVDVGALRAALRQAGWESRPSGGDDGLPSPGVLLALRGVVG